MSRAGWEGAGSEGWTCCRGRGLPAELADVLTRLHFHGAPVCVTLALGVGHFQVKRIGPLNQVGEEEDRVMVGVIQHLLWG